MGSITEPAQQKRPTVALTFGDPAGIGPELAVKLLHNRANLKKANILILADRKELEAAQEAAGGLKVSLSSVAGPHGAQLLDDGTAPESGMIPVSEVSKAAGERAIYQLRRALELSKQGVVDAILFAPLNKSSLKLAGMNEEDELRWFAKQLQYTGTTSEINVAGDLWTGRVTSHIGVEKIAGLVTRETTLNAIELLHKLRWESGIENPRLGVCALNPHAGENGNFGRHEIDHIAPAVQDARAMGIDVVGPFPCDTIFLKRNLFDGIVTMYHDQGQIAMKLLCFDGGVTVQGGLPVVISTPAHGTAFDIVGKNLAGIQSTQNAFDIAVAMAQRRLTEKEDGSEHSAAALEAALRKSKCKLQRMESSQQHAELVSGSCC